MRFISTVYYHFITFAGARVSTAKASTQIVYKLVQVRTSAIRKPHNNAYDRMNAVSKKMYTQIHRIANFPSFKEWQK